MAERGTRFSLAWRLLAFERRRLAAAVAGVTFAVVLILVQIGFYGAMTASATKVQRNLDADLIMVPAGFEYFGSVHDFARVRLMQAAAVPGVAEVLPLYATLVNFKNVDTGYYRSIMAIGVEPGRHELLLPGVLAHQHSLMIAGHILFDRRSLTAYYGDVVHRFTTKGPFTALITGRPVTVDGLFNLGTSFIAFGNILMGAQTYFALQPDLKPSLPNFGLIRLKPGADPVAVRDRIKRTLHAGDVIVETKQAFIQREIDYWNKTAAIGFIFIVGMLMGVLVGSVIVYQILFTDVTEHLPEYAVLKAMGYPNRFFIGTVFEQSLILSVLGFVPGLIISWLIYRYTAATTGYTMNLTVLTAIGVLALTAAMCVVAGLAAMRHLSRADPAELFR
jgi:putative ABC transport system permease protein